MEQPQYNILHRDRFEKEYEKIFKKYKIGSTIWSPLASGILTGKYNDGIPSKSRFKVKGYEWLADSMESVNFDKIKKINTLSKKLGIKSSQLAILWCLKNKNVSSVILGASHLSQLKENLDSLKHIDMIDKKSKSYTQSLCTLHLGPSNKSVMLKTVAMIRPWMFIKDLLERVK